MIKVLLFDIDGTLVLTGGAGLRAMGRAFADVFAIRDGIDRISMNGRTDAWIVRQMTGLHGIDCDAAIMKRFQQAYVRFLADEVLQPGPRKGIMPGVRPLLDALTSRQDAYCALLTGNFEAGARIKLEHFELWHYFKCGAFGDNVAERNGLLAVAMERLREAGGPAASPSDVVIIGDTPLDVAVAVSGGARSVAVATGSHSVAALKEAGADVVLEDLSDLPAVVEACGLKC